MKNLSFKTFIPYITAIVVFASISMIFFFPVLKGYKVKQGDIRQHKGMSHEIKSHKEKFGEDPCGLETCLGECLLIRYQM